MSLRQFGERWIDVGGVRTRYFEGGSGDPVLLMHGGTIGDESAPGNAEEWEYNFPAIVAAGHRAIAVDKLGQGYTDNPLLDEDYSMAGQVTHMANFMRALPFGPFHLVGHSRGGYVACRLTLEFPELVSSCVIVDSNTCAPGIGRNEIVFACNPFPAGSREASGWILSGYSHRDDHVNDAWLDATEKILAQEKYQLAVRKMNLDGLAETVFSPTLCSDRDELFMRLEHEALLRPVLLVWGFNDPTATVDQGYRLFDLIARHQPRCQMHLLNEAGHFSFREQPAAFNRVVTEFLQGVEHGV
jgi:pimeloyl-ACP methyl ester carboxylesterase